MIEQSPKGFNWAMFPPLKGQTQEQAANPQTLSISQQSKHKQAAMQFIAYCVNTQNMAKLAQGDWLIPSNPGRGEQGRQVDQATTAAGATRSPRSSLPQGRTGSRWPRTRAGRPRSRRRRSASTCADQITLRRARQAAHRRMDEHSRA